MIPARGARAAATATLVAVALACTRPVPGRAAVAPPDSARLLGLRAACDSVQQVRITTERSIFIARRPDATAEGILLPKSGGRPALVVTGNPSEPPHLLKWSEIDRVDAERSRILRGTLIGAGVGLAVTGLVVAQRGPDLEEEGDHGVVGLGLVFTAILTGLGFALGASNPALTQLYP